MKIDRHNYEEYFLLYVDNELTADQKRQVESFVKENADLDEELVMLQQSRLIPDNTIVFKDKDVLMREEHSSFIHLGNYEEWLVLYVDDELNAEEKAVVEKFAASHPHVQAELNLFQQTKLQPEEFRFPNKELLHRSEGKVRIITMVWWRAAAAAILIIAGGITMYSVFNDKTGPTNQLTTKKVESPVKAKSTDQQQLPRLIDSDVEKRLAGTSSTRIEKAPSQETVKRQPDNNLSPDNNMAVARKAEIISDFNTPKSKDSQINIVAGPKDKHFINDTTVTKHFAETPDDYASNTENENKRFRGLFRKAARFIERTSGINPANDDDRVLISAMAVNLK